MNEITVKKALQEITSDKNLKVLTYIADLMINNWQKPTLIGSSEWETVKNAVVREERAKALRLFLEEIEKIANTDKNE